MARKQKTKQSGGFRSFIIRVLFVIFVVYVAVSFVQIRIAINEKKEELTLVMDKIALQEQENIRLKDMLENGIDDDYIAEYARKHGYALPDERVYESTT